MARVSAASLVAWILGVLGACGAPAHAAVAMVRLQGVRLSAHGQGAVLSLSLSGPAGLHYFHLAHPQRLVIDLERTQRAVVLPQPQAGGVVEALRAGRRPAHGLRLVLVLRGAVRSRLSRGHGNGGYWVRFELAAAGRTAARPLRPHLARRLRPIRPRHAPPLRHRELVIAVDPGHGGTDSGAIGPDGTEEKNITLAIGRDLAARIDRAPGMRAVLTRTADYYVGLRERMAIARRDHADMFVSIHADAVRDPLVTGASVYVLSEHGASNEAARELAASENRADLRGGIQLDRQSPGLRSVLLSLSQQASISESSQAGADVLHALDRIGPVHYDTVQHAAFIVLESPDIPSMLVETNYISNPADERDLRLPAEQRRIAEAVFRGIRAYFRAHPPLGSYFAHIRRDRARRVARGPVAGDLARSGS